MVGGLGYRHLTLRERVGLLAAGGRFVARHLRGALGGETVAETLASLGQGRRERRTFWDPLSIAVLNESPEAASAGLFGEVLRRVFVGGRSASDLVLPRTGLSELFAEPGRKAIEAAGGSVEVGRGAVGVALSGDRAGAVRWADGSETVADAVVLAVTPTKLGDLLPASLRPAFSSIARLEPSPIVSVHLWLKRPVATPRMIGFLDGPLHWLFTPPMQPAGGRYVTLVASGARELAARDPGEVLSAAGVALAQYLPEAADSPRSGSLVVKEHSATFVASPGEQACRPGVATPIANLFLAGDWIDTGLPATIESAVESGNRAARAVAVALAH